MSFRTQGLDHVAIEVADLDASEAFYREVLGLERVHEAWDPPRVMAADGSGMALFPRDEGEPGPQLSDTALHIAFRVGRQDFDAARAELAERGIETEFSDHDLAHSIYFDDPDGHHLELTTYEV